MKQSSYCFTYKLFANSDQRTTFLPSRRAVLRSAAFGTSWTAARQRETICLFLTFDKFLIEIIVPATIGTFPNPLCAILKSFDVNSVWYK